MDFNDKIARASLHVEVADRVREMIFDRSLPPGFRIDELDLSARLGTSRTPLREALKVLANEGLVRLAPGRGAYVTELSAQEVDSLFPVLAMLESRCTGEAVRRLGVSDLRRLDALHQKMEAHVAEGDAQAYHHAADELHALLQRAAGNPWLQRATADLCRFLRLARSAFRLGEARLLQSLAEHRALMKAISRGDAEGAEQIMHHHLQAQQKAWRVAHAASRQEQAEAEQAREAEGAAAGSDGEGGRPADVNAAAVPAALPGETSPANGATAATPAAAATPDAGPAAIRHDTMSVSAHSHREAESIGV